MTNEERILIYDREYLQASIHVYAGGGMSLSMLKDTFKKYGWRIDTRTMSPTRQCVRVINPLGCVERLVYRPVMEKVTP